MEPATSPDRRLDVAVQASLGWYEDVFSAHGIPSRIENGLWSALGNPPRWHSAAKTLRPDVPATQVLRAVERFGRCSVADSFATLDLAGHGFRRLFRATWFHRPPSEGAHKPWPDGWSVVTTEDELDRWNAAHDTTGVLLASLLENPRFALVARHASGSLVAGAVLHRVGDAVELSNTWAVGDEADEITEMLDCADTLHPGLSVVGYTDDATLSHVTDAGLQPVGPHVVWVREE